MLPRERRSPAKLRGTEIPHGGRAPATRRKARARTMRRGGEAMPPRQPNILLIMADQLTALALPCYGHPVVEPPHLDAAGRRGRPVRERLLQLPALRAVALLACWPAGCRRGSAPTTTRPSSPPALPTIAHGLRALGYRTCLAGKMHFVGPDQLHGFEERLTTDIYPADFGWTPDWDAARGADRLVVPQHAERVSRPASPRRTNQLDFDEEVAFQAERALRPAPEQRRAPVLPGVSFTHPHDPYACGAHTGTATTTTRSTCRAVPALPVERMDPHSRRLPGLRHGRGDDHRGQRAPGAARLLRHDRAMSTTRSGGCSRRCERFGLEDDTVVSSPPITATCWASAASGTRCASSNGRCACRCLSARRAASRRAACDAGLAARPAADPARPRRRAGRARSSPADGGASRRCSQGGELPERTVLGEYLAEGALAPIFMIRAAPEVHLERARPAAPVRPRARRRRAPEPRRLA